jgi:CBS domain-containing protein
MSAISRTDNRTHRTGAETTARDLMTANPVSISATATLDEVVAFLTDTGYSAAPVIDEAGRPLGVVSRTDVVVYDRAQVAAAHDVSDYYDRPVLTAGHGEAPAATSTGSGAVVRASHLMTPLIYAVTPQTPVARVAAQMADRNVHRLFVVDGDGVLVGVLSALDLLRHFASTA